MGLSKSGLNIEMVLRVRLFLHWNNLFGTKKGGLRSRVVLVLSGLNSGTLLYFSGATVYWGKYILDIRLAGMSCQPCGQVDRIVACKVNFFMPFNYLCLLRPTVIKFSVKEANVKNKYLDCFWEYREKRLRSLKNRKKYVSGW